MNQALTKIDELVALIRGYNKDGVLKEHTQEILKLKEKFAETIDISELNQIINQKLQEK